jgi:hypothetical protein
MATGAQTALESCLSSRLSISNGLEADYSHVSLAPNLAGVDAGDQGVIEP